MGLYNLLKRILLGIKIFLYKSLIDQALFIWRKVEILLYGPEEGKDFTFYSLLFGKIMAYASDNYFFSGLIKPFKFFIARGVPVYPEYAWHPSSLLYKDFNFTEKNQRYNMPRDAFYLGLLNRAYVILRRKFYLDLKRQTLAVMFFVFINIAFYLTIILYKTWITSLLFSYLISVIITPVIFVLLCQWNLERYRRECIGLKLAIFKPLYLNPKLRKYSSQVALNFRWLDFWLNKEKDVVKTNEELLLSLQKEDQQVFEVKKTKLNKTSRKSFLAGLFFVFIICFIFYLFFYFKFYFFYFLFIIIVVLKILSKIEKLKYPYSTTLTSFENHKFFPSVGYLYPSNSEFIKKIVSVSNMDTNYNNAIKEKMKHDINYVEILKLIDGLSAFAFLLTSTKNKKLVSIVGKTDKKEERERYPDLTGYFEEEDIQIEEQEIDKGKVVPYLYELTEGLRELEKELKLNFDFMSELPFDPFMSLVELRAEFEKLKTDIEKTERQLRILKKQKTPAQREIELELERLGLKKSEEKEVNFFEYYNNKRALISELLKLFVYKLRFKLLKASIASVLKRLQKDLRELVLYRYAKDMRIKNLSEIIHLNYNDDWFKINYVWNLWDFANPVYYFIFLFSIPYSLYTWKLNNFKLFNKTFYYFYLTRTKSYVFEVSLSLDLRKLNYTNYLKNASNDDFLKLLYPYSFHDNRLFKGYVQVGLSADKKVKFTKLS